MFESERDWSKLTQRDMDILDLACDGLTDQQIANRLGIGRGTVVGYWTRIRLKMNVSSRTEAVSVLQQRNADSLQTEQYALRSLLEVKSEEAKKLLKREAELQNTVSQRAAELVKLNESLKKEIERRGQTEEALRRSEERYRNLYNNAEIAMFTSKIDGTELIEINAKAIAMLGGDRTPYLGKPTASWWVDKKERAEIINELRRSGSIVDRVCRFRMGNRNVRHCSLSATIHLDRGEIEWSAIDVSAKVQAESVISRNVERGKLLLELHENCPDMDDNELCRYALDIAIQLTDSKIGFLHYVGADQETLMPSLWNVEASGQCSCAIDAHYQLKDAGFWADCLREGRPRIYNDLSKIDSARGFPQGHCKLSRLACLPAIDDGMVRYVIGVGNKAGDYGQDDIDAIERLNRDLICILASRLKVNRLVVSEQNAQRQLQSILNPPDRYQSIDVRDIIDVGHIQTLFDQLYRLTRISSALVDTKGNVLAKTGWQDICTRFHRVHPDSCANCIESDTTLSLGVEPGTFKVYKCKNNLWDLATPIVIDGQHMANLFIGQFFFDHDNIDIDQFEAQAVKYGYDKELYLEALHRVPRYTPDHVHSAIVVYSNVANSIASLSYSNLKIAHNLQERNQSMDQAQVEHDRYRALVDSMCDVMCETDVEYRFTYVGPQIVHSLGYSPDELMGTDAKDIAYQIDLDSHTSLFESVLEERSSFSDFEILLMAKNGVAATYLISGVPMFDEEHRLAGYRFWGRDVTASRRAQEAHRVSEEKYRIAFQTSPDSITINRKSDGTYLEVNEGFCRLVGYRPEEVLGRTSVELGIWFDVEIRKQILHQIDTLGEASVEAWIVRKDGSRFLAMVSARLITIAEVECILMVGKDLTDRLKHEEQLKERELLLEEASHIAGLETWILDHKTKTMTCSEGMLRLFNIEPSRYGERQDEIYEYVHEDDRGWVKRAFEESIITNGTFDVEHRLLPVDGHIKWVHALCRTTFGPFGEPIKTVGTVQDVTKLHEKNANHPQP